MKTVIEDEIAREVVDAAFKVHTKLGPGLLESGKQCTTAGTAYVLCVRQCAVTVGRLQS